MVGSRVPRDRRPPRPSCNGLIRPSLTNARPSPVHQKPVVGSRVPRDRHPSWNNWIHPNLTDARPSSVRQKPVVGSRVPRDRCPVAARMKSVICPPFGLSGRNERQRMESAQSAARRKPSAKRPSPCPDVDTPPSTVPRKRRAARRPPARGRVMRFCVTAAHHPFTG